MNISRKIALLLIGSIFCIASNVFAQKPVNPNANKEAIALKALLDSLYGKKIISGQAYESVDEKWNEYIQSVTGKTPAILSLDFMNSMPWRVSQGADPDTTTKLAIDWAKNKGGIVEMHWHWDAPKGVTAGSWQGFYTKNTTFDIAKALSDTSLEDYKLIIRDIDIVAARLKRMQDSGVAVLWRPVHEAEGTWFWWGAKGGAACKKLWNLVYDRLTNYHNLNNLIWVWNSYGSDKGNWYPGDSTVDIVAWDYESSNSWSQYQTLFGTKGKLFALGEEGKVPDPASYSKKPWLYFITWAYMVKDPSVKDGKNSKDWLSQTYNDPRVLTLDDLTPGPKAYAGKSQTVIDMDDNGIESINLDGSASYANSTTDSIVSYIWKEKDSIIGSEVKPTVELPIGTHIISLTITTSNSLSKKALVTIIVKKLTLSYLKAAKASTTEANSGNVAANANDGNNDTRWSSIYADPQWYEIDLGKPCDIEEVIITWETAAAKNYEIQESNNDTEWYSVVTKTSMPAGPRTDIIKGLTGGARYIRMYGLQRNTTWGYSIYEFEVYGKENASAQPVGNIFSSISESNTINAAIYPTILSNNELLHIKTSAKSGNMDVSIFDINGKLVLKQNKSTNDNILNINSLTKGFYTIQIDNKKGRSISKFIIN